MGRRVPQGTPVAERAVALALGVSWDLDPDGVDACRQAPRRPPMPFLSWLVGAAFLGALIWISYWLQAQGPILGGNCAPRAPSVPKGS